MIPISRALTICSNAPMLKCAPILPCRPGSIFISPKPVKNDAEPYMLLTSKNVSWFSSLYFIYKQWKYQQAQQALLGDKDSDLLTWTSIIIVLFLYLAWRLYLTRRQMIRKKHQSETGTESGNNSGMDSELYLIEQALSKTENARLNNESVAVWAKRVNIEALMLITKIHYSYRFDPQGISDQQREQLKQRVKNLLEEYG